MPRAILFIAQLEVSPVYACEVAENFLDAALTICLPKSAKLSLPLLLHKPWMLQTLHNSLPLIIYPLKCSGCRHSLPHLHFLFPSVLSLPFPPTLHSEFLFFVNFTQLQSSEPTYSIESKASMLERET